MNFVQSLIELLKSFWPLAIIQSWERGEYYVCGHRWKTVGPGLKAFVPWFSEVISVDTQPTPISTPRMDLTLKSGGNISFVATAVIQVSNPELAIAAIDDYKQSTHEILAAVLADRLVRVKEDRLDAENRASLLRDLTKWVSEETLLFGVGCNSVRFTTFVQGARTYRILTETPPPQW
jgi:regulator of protease activity HflC (stomatin/prohibitin superfamily)